MGMMRERLDGAFGAGHTQLDPSTGSVLVHYNARAHSSADVLSILKDVGVILEETARGVGLEVPETGASTTSTHIVNAVSDLDRRLSLLTGRRVDLKLLFPATLGGIGLWRALTGGLGLTEVPAYVLLWYAFDAFWKFHREPVRASRHEAEHRSAERPADQPQHAAP
jgi:hypothetical protein